MKRLKRLALTLAPFTVRVLSTEGTYTHRATPTPKHWTGRDAIPKTGGASLSLAALAVYLLKGLDNETVLRGISPHIFYKCLG